MGDCGSPWLMCLGIGSTAIVGAIILYYICRFVSATIELFESVKRSEKNIEYLDSQKYKFSLRESEDHLWKALCDLEEKINAPKMKRGKPGNG